MPGRGKRGSFRIAGIDPGTRRTGLAILEVSGQKLRMLHAEVISVTTRDVAKRLQALFARLEAPLARYRPRIVVIERAYVGLNPLSALTLGTARGVAMVCAARSGAEVAEVTAVEAKRATGAGGCAGKADVQRMTQLILGLSKPLQPDAADAVALALWGAYNVPLC